MLLQWTEDLSVQVPELDEHHKQMVVLINKLHNALAQRDNNVATDVLFELGDYANYHFGAEEALFESVNYPFADEHIEQHLIFREHLRELKDLVEASDEHAMEKLIGFLYPWWSTHLMVYDHKYIPYLKNVRI
jgi:hemerythrin-like metal-binding protein